MAGQGAIAAEERRGAGIGRDARRGAAAAALGVALTAAAAAALAAALREVDPHKLSAALRATPPQSLALAAAATMAGYAVLIGYDLAALRWLGRPLAARRAAAGALAAFAIGNTLGFGARPCAGGSTGDGGLARRMRPRWRALRRCHSSWAWRRSASARCCWRQTRLAPRRHGRPKRCAPGRPRRR
ncbi:hypothetical protein [Oceanicella actignis]|uniref:hypothetical protein n=1 Tax=Oceanicella actignis TaxID=1189325 RepID=UPI0009F8CC7B|nr:hypothetical protein [Oceanicella actignis]